MGSCVCKSNHEDENGSTTDRVGAVTQCCQEESYNKHLLSDTIDKLVSDTLNVIETIVDNEPDPPSSILLLHSITENPNGWIELIYSLMRIVPIEHPMGPSVITLLLDDSPLPTKQTVLKVSNIVTTLKGGNLRMERNFCVILGCLAEKLAGSNSISLLNKSTLDYLVFNISEDATDANIKLLSLIALEKFALTSENKNTIKKCLEAISPNPLESLEHNATSCNLLLRQIGFCARWCLDNYFIHADRKYSYEMENVSHINAMLNTHDVSEYLKIAPDGLEARCDAYTFESVRCTFQISDGCWYYEVLIITPGVMQIGWATKNASFLSDDGYGIGDDKYSVGFDGCRKLIWHNAKSIPQNLPSWKAGTILGCLLSLDTNEVIFYLNGVPSALHKNIFLHERDGFFAAASFMSFQQCRFNFGAEPFKFAPNRAFKSFNENGLISPEDKIVLPRHLYLNILRQIKAEEDSCTLCFDRKGVFKVHPCQHSGFCKTCIDQLKFCPMCRREIQDIFKIYGNDVKL